MGLWVAATLGILILWGKLGSYWHLPGVMALTVLLSLYGAILFTDNNLSSRAHTPNRPTPWVLLFAAFSGSIWAINYQFDYPMKPRALTLVREFPEEGLSVLGIRVESKHEDIRARLGEPRGLMAWPPNSKELLNIQRTRVHFDYMRSARRSRSSRIRVKGGHKLAKLARTLEKLEDVTEPDRLPGPKFHSAFIFAKDWGKGLEEGNELDVVVLPKSLGETTYAEYKKALRFVGSREEAFLLSADPKPGKASLLGPGWLLEEKLEKRSLVWVFADKGVRVTFSGPSETDGIAKVEGEELWLNGKPWLKKGDAVRRAEYAAQVNLRFTEDKKERIQAFSLVGQKR